MIKIICVILLLVTLPHLEVYSKNLSSSGGAATVKLDDLQEPDDNTDLDATTSRHGLLLKLGGGSVNFLRADGTWSPPPGAAGGETNTASSSGSGASIFDAKVGADLQFNGIKSETAALTVTVDATSNDVELTVVDSGINHSGISNLGWEDSGHTGTGLNIAGWSGGGTPDEISLGSTLQIVSSLMTVNDFGVNHDWLLNYDAGEHIDHSSVSVIAGTGLTGGGTIDSTVTINVDSALTISGGTIDSSVIGGTTPATGSFTTLDATQQIYTATSSQSPTTKNITIDFNNGESQSVDLESVGADVDITFSNIVTGNAYLIDFIQGATARQFSTITPGVTWEGGSTANITTTANASSVIGLWKSPSGTIFANGGDFH